MIDFEARVMELSRDRYCCAQIIMIICLERLGKDNPDMVKAMQGLCNGLHSRETCGCLSGAACMLALMQPHYAAILVPELLAWFEGRYGSTNCHDLIGRDRNNVAKCLDMVTNTCGYCFEMLAEKDLLDGGACD